MNSRQQDAFMEREIRMKNSLTKEKVKDKIE